jgi:ATP-dependent protease ClpP protease subunit
MPEPLGQPSSAYEQHFRKWLDAHKGEGQRQFSAVVNGAELELSILDTIGYDWWTGGGVTAKWVKSKIDANPDVTLVRVLIDSPGGSVFDGVAIHNILKRSKATVEIEVIGEASSAASVIAMAGNTIKMHEGTSMMIHRASCMCGGFADDMRTAADALDVITGGIIDVYESRTGRARGDIEAMVKKETWMSARDAVKQGFADEVVKAGNQTATTPPVKGKAKNETDGVIHNLNIEVDLSELEGVAERIESAISAGLVNAQERGIAASATSTATTPEPIAPDEAPEPTNAPPAHEEETTMSEVTTMIRAVLGLGAGTPDSDVTAAVTRLRDLERKAVSVTGAKSTEEAHGALDALKAKADECDTMKPELEKIRNDRDRQNFETLIAKGQSNPVKLTPATAKLYREQFEAAVAEGNGAREVERLQGFLSIAPTIAALSTSTITARAPVGGDAPPTFDGKAYEQLAFSAKAALKTQQPELFALMKQDWERRGKPATKAA